MKTISFSALLTMATATTLLGFPPTNGPQWWSTDPNLECASIHALIFEIPLASGGIGLACGVSGTFPWLAAGGGWDTAIRTAAPDSGAIGIQYVFYDGDGNRVSFDTAGSIAESGSTVSLALQANQPSEVRLLGASVDIPQYGRTQSGSVLGFFYCPSPAVCAAVLPQLFFSAVPAKPWSLSAPIAWETSFSTQQPAGLSTRWSAVGIADPAHTIAFAIYNRSPVAATYTVRVYNGNGALAAQVSTPPVPGFSAADGEGGTRAFLLSDVLTTAPPQGIIKVTIEGNSPSYARFFQFNHDSATSLETARD